MKLLRLGYAQWLFSRTNGNDDYRQYCSITLYQGHHTVQKSMLTVADAAAVAKKHQVPLIVDAAAEEDLYKYTQAGADLVIYSGAKAIEGPSSGLVIGTAKYIEWVRLQGKGIGRAMKIGKDNILGFTQAFGGSFTKWQRVR